MNTRQHLAQVREADGTLSYYATDGKALAYLDRDACVLCAGCANENDSDPDAIPSFKPQAWFVLESPDDDDITCEECSELLDARLRPAHEVTSFSPTEPTYCEPLV